ncbi:MAG: hypothetical protein ACE37F_08780 [Nannocystaceae bacterium]|nr:hypothetical protein [bacterium]
MDLCGDDIDALAQTVVDNLDAVAAAGQQALIVFPQGINLPPTWLDECETFELATANFSGTTCVPWDASYQASLETAVQTLGTAISGHAALAGVYFTISSMTNGSELHWRVSRDAMPNYPGDEAFRQAYRDVMDVFQLAFDEPVVFEAGHCVWDEDPDCELPTLLYRHSRDTYGVGHSGIAIWNCAERFWAGNSGGAETFGVKGLLEEASSDGASFGCQTVGSFTNGACRFTDDEVGDYGPSEGLMGDNCPEHPSFDPAGACLDTMRWVAGVEAQATDSAQVTGTWLENWSAEFREGGVYTTDESCRAAIDAFAAPQSRRTGR